MKRTEIIRFEFVFRASAQPTDGQENSTKTIKKRTHRLYVMSIHNIIMLRHLLRYSNKQFSTYSVRCRRPLRHISLGCIMDVCTDGNRAEKKNRSNNKNTCYCTIRYYRYYNIDDDYVQCARGPQTRFRFDDFRGTEGRVGCENGFLTLVINNILFGVHVYFNGNCVKIRCTRLGQYKYMSLGMPVGYKTSFATEWQSHGFHLK